MRGWETGCKGVTIYRDGCRSGVLVADEPKSDVKKDASGQPEKLIENHAPKRPKELPCDIHRINVRSGDAQETYLVLVGRLDGKPYEIFCGLSRHVEVPKKSKSGILIKNGKREALPHIICRFLSVMMISFFSKMLLSSSIIQTTEPLLDLCL